MIETLIGGLLGGAARLAPEVLKWLDRKDERAHELALLDKNLEADKLKGDQAMAKARVEGGTSLDLETLKSFATSLAGQSQLTGIKWIDGLSASVRPVVTYLIFGMYAVAKFSGYTITPDDNALFAAVFNFWFMGRVFDKYRV